MFGVSAAFKTSVKEAGSLKHSGNGTHVLNAKTFASPKLTSKDLLDSEIRVLARLTCKVLEVNQIVCNL